MPQVFGTADNVPGVLGVSNNNIGVKGSSSNSTGVFGESTIVVDEGFSSDWIGVHGKSTSGIGVFAEGRAAGVHAVSPGGRGVLASSDRDTAVYAESKEGGLGVQAISPRGTGVFAMGQPAGRFNGLVTIDGDLQVMNGHKPFKIDHPLDPQNKYLLHNAVESPEMKNVYDGVAQLDADGTASVDLPEWFEALNGDFRYQLTPVGQAAPGLHVAEEVSENRFKIAGGEGGIKVCWQVTGARKDRWAAANPFEVEQEKPQEERGRYLQPSLYGAPEEQSVMRAHIPQPPPSFEPPQPQEMPPGAPPMPPGVAAPGVGLMEEEHGRQIDELRGQIEELRRTSLEEEIDELRGQIKKLRRRRKR